MAQRRSLVGLDSAVRLANKRHVGHAEGSFRAKAFIQNSLVVLLWFRPDLGITFFIHLNVDRIGSAADRTVFNIRLT